MIKNAAELIRAGEMPKEKQIRKEVVDILEFVLKSADPADLTREILKKINFSRYQRIFVIGAGKATYRMAWAAERFLGKRLTGGTINVPQAIKNGHLKKIKLTLAGHPFTTASGVAGTKKIIELIKEAGPKDLILALFSGGASALFELPVAGITLPDQIKTTELLIRSRATIQEINSVRKHLSQVKGGQLAQKSQRTNLMALYLSDVVGDDLATIASGPTVPDATTFGQAVKILKKYNLWSKTPADVKRYLSDGQKGLNPETIKTKQSNTKNILISGRQTLIASAEKKARRLGYRISLIEKELVGDTEKKGRELLKAALKGKIDHKKIFMAAGETTFEVRTNKPGGRLQQMGLAVLSGLKHGLIFVALASDGVDGVGPEKIGGVIIDQKNFIKAGALRIDIKKTLQTNDSYNFFKKVGGQIKTGYVGTNLGDLILLIRF